MIMILSQVQTNFNLIFISNTYFMTDKLNLANFFLGGKKFFIYYIMILQYGFYTVTGNQFSHVPNE